MSASILGCWIDVGFDSWMLDRCCFDSLTLDRWMSASILGCWIDVSFDSLTLDIDFDSRVSDIYRLRFFGFGYIDIGFVNFETLKNINSRRDKHEILVTSFSNLWMCKFLL
ncbi:hypothetical protein RhiirA4_486455 [Rhizophagus irregularis]|uniref:Uncharacterized protein n=1 Tax=Rhizophagus irregularis TaxID=588596 RepID=A0A2I1HRM6_9GLOM|nr:hypothetical protein RhiirA4_486455 [Rhizophagus irregularis]